MINLELDIRSAASIRQVLFYEQQRYTLDTDTCPPRIQDIRNTIVELDNKIEEALKDEDSDT